MGGIETLVLAPHLDDEVLGCYSFLGSRTHVAYFDLRDGPGSEPLVRLDELEDVAALTGHRWDVMPGYLQDRSMYDLVAEIESLVDRHRPETLLVPAPSYHRDHQMVHGAGVAACRPHDRNPRVSCVLVYEQPQVVLWPAAPFRPTAFREVDLEAKLTAYRAYASQVRGHRSEEIVRALAVLRGAQAGMAAAEGFEVRRITV